MKKLIVVIVALISFSSFQLQAQSKIAHVNSQTLYDTLPSYKSAKKQLEDYQAAGFKQLQEMDAELQKAYQKYMAERESLSPLLQQFEEERLQKKQAELQQYEQELQQILGKMSQELNEPITKRITKAVEMVAERKKLNYVVEQSTTLYFKGGVDITNEVIVELLKLDALETKKP